MIVPGPDHPQADIISLLQCVVEQMDLPEHRRDLCGSTDCRRCVADHYRKELEAAYKPKPSDKRFFPMLDGPALPRDLGTAVWEFLYNPRYHDQSAERLAERGGFGWEEVKRMAADLCTQNGWPVRR